MIEVTGNLWDYPAEVTGITTNGFVRLNGRCVMGRGCAREARDRYPDLDLRLGRLIEQHGNRCFRIVVSDRTILTFVVKPRALDDGTPGWRGRADLDLIALSCAQATEMADKFGWRTICLPRPGCGNGHLRWYEDVRPVIAELLDDRFRVITFG